jgi:hypothetical protein
MMLRMGRKGKKGGRREKNEDEGASIIGWRKDGLENGGRGVKTGVEYSSQRKDV